ncbi:MAG: peptide/nickel transport system ATP-binding protein [Actinomycetota bacterium]|nr:peptide/nickel transport system ATP-binding protein [Actinomycetota bacterium]
MIAGGVITGAFVVMAVLAPLVAPYGEAQYRGLPQLARPSAHHWFGTTNLRYDVFSRVVYGTRLAFQVVILSTALAMVLGVPLGLVAGYSGKRLDRVLVLLMDAMYAFPSLLLAIVAAFALARYVGQGVPAAALSISVIYVPQYFRVVRNHTLAVREETFVEAARAMGATRRTIVGRYVFFNVVQSVPVIFTVNAADAILTLAALGFLGYGVPIPAAEWGYDISRAIGDVANGFWWTSLFPGLFILALVTGLTLLGEGINDIVNPLLRRRGVGVGGVAPGALVVERAAVSVEPPVAAGVEDTAAAVAVADLDSLDPLDSVSVTKPLQEVVAAVPPTGPDGVAGAEVALSVRDLRVTYASGRGPVVAVDGVSLELGRGESIGLVGESGCGKSTLGRGMIGVLPQGATVAGRVFVGGQELSAMGPAERRRARGERIALIFQEPMTRLDPLQRVEAHFVETIRAHRPGVSRSEARTMAATALAAMRIPPTRARNYPHEFSGGMRQRIMIALGLVLGPSVLVADEPTTSLDVIVEAQILEILDDLRRRSDMALVLITHNLGIVAQTCDRLAVMYAGQIVEQGRVGPVFSSPRHPYTQGLLASVISLDTQRLSSIPGSPPDLLQPPAGCRFAERCPFAMDVCHARTPALATMDDGSQVACHLYPGADPAHPGQRWAPVGRRDKLDDPAIEAVLR